MLKLVSLLQHSGGISFRGVRAKPCTYMSSHTYLDTVTNCYVLSNMYHISTYTHIHTHAHTSWATGNLRESLCWPIGCGQMFFSDLVAGRRKKEEKCGIVRIPTKSARLPTQSIPIPLPLLLEMKKAFLQQMIKAYLMYIPNLHTSYLMRNPFRRQLGGSYATWHTVHSYHSQQHNRYHSQSMHWIGST